MAKLPGTRRRASPVAPRRRAAQRAFTALLDSLGVKRQGELRHAPARAAALWTDYLLRGEGADLGKIIGEGVAHRSQTPVCVADMDVHMVCPHHLTVAFGTVHVAYIPAGRVAGLGALSDLAQACTARFVLQEQASQDIADALVTCLQARAAVALIEAVHPCHNIPHPRSHRARAVSWAHAGDAAAVRPLRELVQAALRREKA